MKSMTGYGKAVATDGVRELTVELKSVNHRFLDISTKIPRAFIAYEDVIRSCLSAGLNRGHVDVFVNYKLSDGADKEVQVNTKLASSYVAAAKTVKELFPELKDDFTVSSVLRSPDVLELVQSEDDEGQIRSLLISATNQAVEKLNAMRETEGNKLREDLLTKIQNIESLLTTVKKYAPLVALQYRDKLTARITEALKGVELDEVKLANEVCFFADKSCIDEEITRLTSHIAHAREILSAEDSVGRKMDFLVQEFNREVNTICSKSANAELTDTALKMKNEVEKLREQVQNLE